MDKLSLGKAYVQIIPSADGISGKIKDELAGGASEAGDHAGTTIASRIKGAIIKAGIGTALVGVFKLAVDEGAKLEQSIGGIETLFKDSAGQMEKYAKEAFQTAGLSANEYMEQATSFAAGLIKSTGGDTKKAADIANMAMIDMSDNMNKMGSNAEDIQNAYQGFAKQNYTMLDNLKLGYGGTKEEMQRLLTDAQKLTGVKYDINNLSDVYSAIHAIQEDLDITGTTAKEASTTFSGSFGMMKASAQNLLGYMATGMDIGPAVKDLVESASTFLFGNALPMFGRVALAIPGALIDGVKTAIPIMIEKGKEIIQSFGTGMAEEFPALAGIFNNLLPILETIGTVIGAWKIAELLMKIPAAISTVMGPLSSFIGMVASAGGGLTGFGSAIMSVIGGPITLITAAIASVVAAFMYLWNTNEEFRNNIVSIWNEIHDKISNFLTRITMRINDLGFNFSDITEVIKAIWTEFCEFLAPIFEGAFQQVSNIISYALDTISGIIGTFIALINGDWEGFWQGIQDIVDAAWGYVYDTVANVITMITELIKTFLSWFGIEWDVDLDAILGIWDTVWTEISGLIDSVLSIIQDLVAGFIALINGDWDGFCQHLSNAWQTIWDGIKSVGQRIWDEIQNIFRSIWDSIKSKFDNILQSMQTKAENIWNGILGTAKNIFNGIKSAIENPMETAKNFVRSIIEKIKGFFNFSISWPHIPLPHFSIKPSGWNIGDLLKGKIPSLGIDWYAKAMDSGMILNGATIFGYDGKQFLGGGEAGPEAVVGVNSLMSMIKNAVAAVDSNIGSSNWDYDQLTKAVISAIETLKLETNVVIDGRMIQKIIGQVCDRDDRSYVIARGG